MHRVTLFILLSFILGALSGCNEEEEIPSFIHIEDISLKTKSGEGSNSNVIKDAWVFIDDNLHGTYELPADIPILQEGTINVKVRAGIKNNGQVKDRKRYTFYTRYDTTVTISPDTATAVTPTVEYVEGTDFWIEDFEDPGISFTKSNSSDTGMFHVNNDEDVFEGNASGNVVLEGDKEYALLKTNKNFTFSIGQTVYLEMDYKIDNTMNVGLIVDDGESFDKTGIITLKETDGEWNKIYLDLSPITSRSETEDYELYFEKLIKDTESEDASMYFDNIKIVS